MERIAQPFSGSLSFVPVAAGAANWIPIAILGLWVCGFVAIALIRLRSWLRIRAAVIVRERATGRMFGETIDFEVK
jgi:hypothetical protein